MVRNDSARKTKSELELEVAALRAELRALNDRAPLVSDTHQQIVEAMHSLQVHQEELNAQNEQLRQTQLTLEQTSQKYHDLFECSPAGYFIIDSSFSVVDVNVAGMEMLSRTKGRIIGKPFLIFVDKPSRRALDSHFLRVRGAGGASGEIWLLPEQGEPFPAILQSVALGSSWGENWRCLTAMFDITDRKAAEMAVRASEARFRAIFEQNPLAVRIVDQTNSSQMSNRAWTRLWGTGGLRRDEDIAPPPPPLDMTRYIARAINGDSIEVPPVHLTADGRDHPERWIRSFVYPIQDGSGSIKEVVVVHEDITERMRIEIDLEERTRRLQRQYDNLRALSEIAALPSGIGAAQQLAAALDLGRRHLEQAVGVICRLSDGLITVEHRSGPDNLVPTQGETIALSESLCSLVIESGNVIAENDLAASPHACHPGRFAPVIGSYLGAPIRFRGRMYGTLAFHGPNPAPRIYDAGDIEFMRLLARLVGAVLEQDEDRRELARSNAELEQFAYVASHDLRQPLRQVSSYVSLLTRRYGDQLDDTAREFIAFAHDGAVRMDRLIVDLLEYSRIGRNAKPLGPVNLALVIADAGATLSGALGETGGRIEVASPLPVVRGDHTDLVRLFQNLIGNAIKYRSPKRPPLIRIHAESTPTEHQIVVADNGIGIEPDYFDTIFRIFQRLHTPDKYEGTGIGLAICKKVVEQHQGRIWVDSIPGSGATFHVALPNRT